MEGQSTFPYWAIVIFVACAVVTASGRFYKNCEIGKGLAWIAAKCGRHRQTTPEVLAGAGAAGVFEGAAGGSPACNPGENVPQQPTPPPPVLQRGQDIQLTDLDTRLSCHTSEQPAASSQSEQPCRHATIPCTTRYPVIPKRQHQKQRRRHIYDFRQASGPNNCMPNQSGDGPRCPFWSSLLGTF